MPAIKEYTAQADTLHPTETGADAYAQAGRRIGGFYNQAGEALKSSAEDRARAAGRVATAEEERFKSYSGIAKDVGDAADQAEAYAAHQEVSHGAASFAQGAAGLTQQWNDTVKSADPNDTSLQSKFMQATFEPWAEEYIKGFNTPQAQDWAQEHVAHLRDHLYEKTNADMMTLAGDAVTTNIRKMSSSWTNQARGDPSSVPWLLDSAGRSIDGVISSSPTLSGTAAQKVRTEILDQTQRQIVKAGALGAIENAKDPEAAAKAYGARYPQFVDAQELDQLSKSARYYQHLNDTQSKAALGQQIKEQRVDFEKQLNGVKTSLWGDDGFQVPPGTVAKLRELGTHPLIAGGDQQSMKDLYSTYQKVQKITDRMNKPEPLAQTSHETTVGLLQQIRNGNMKDDGAIVDALPKLSKGDYKFLEREFQNLQTPEGEHRNSMMRTLTQSVRPTLTRNGQFDPDSADRLYRWNTEVNRKFDELRQKGQDPFAVFDPGKPEYMGSQEALRPFLGSMQRQLQDAIKAGGGVGAPPPTPPVYTAPKPTEGFKPPAGWETNGKMYRDPKGNLYDLSGKPVS